MYVLESFADGYAHVTGENYDARFLADTAAAAQALVDAMNARILPDALAAYRYSVETSGVTVNGATILTDRGSQSTLTGAYQALTAGLVPSIDWKAEGGVWVTMTTTDLQPIAVAVTQHVQNCFSAEKQVAAQIDNGTVTDVAGVHAAFDAALAAQG